ncbi:HAD family hydrolase [Saccharopolyspora sp. CA-218241]|uniref:HAD family hydrolase n=1 Tax=Saccharopolyspora sp. CA-218241 TaxID=3240027 RepID=UPI003D98C28D
MTSLATRVPRHIVWDWNGTLLSDNHAVVEAVNVVCTAFERDHIDIDEWRSLFGRPLQKCYERLLRRSLDEQDWARIDVLYHDAYRDLLHSCRLADGVPNLLADWAGTGRSQSLLSMWFHDELVPLVSSMGLDGYFSRVDGLREDLGGGSKAEHLVRHMDALELDPRDVVLIGDVLDDAHAAQRAGTDCVLLTTGVMSRTALEEAGCPVVDSISEALARVDGRTG